jgi:hypothetical protein
MQVQLLAQQLSPLGAYPLQVLNGIG